jgi:ferredoxin
MVTLMIDGIQISVPEGTKILDAAQQAGIYIPRICSHPDLPPVNRLTPADVVYRGSQQIKNKKPELLYEGCRLCVVEIEGKDGLHRACNTTVADQMVVHTTTPAVEESRRDRLMLLLAKHPHACLTCAQKEGCVLFPCSMNVPELERCCAQFGRCEFQKVAEYIKIKPETPRYYFEDLPHIKDEPLFERNYNLCIGCTRCIRVCREVNEVKAVDFVFDEEGRVVIGMVGPNLRESACRFCMACVEVCPAGTLLAKKPHDFPLLFAKPILPPRKRLWVEFNRENVADVPEKEGVFQLLDEQETVIYIKGAINLKHELTDQLELNQEAKFFMYIEDQMFSKRESEMLQHYIIEHGKMPKTNQEMEDLF